MDFVSDSLSNVRRIKYHTVSDDFSHDCIDIAVNFGTSGQSATRLLDRTLIFRGYPVAGRTDNWPEFTSRPLLAWTTLHAIRLILIQPDRPMQKGYNEGLACPKFSRQIVLSKSEWEKCKKPNTQLNSNTRRSPSYRQGPPCNRCRQATRNWGGPCSAPGSRSSRWPMSQLPSMT
jgi:hypothetical protein